METGEPSHHPPSSSSRCRPAGYHTHVTAGTVIKLCNEGHLTAAVQALDVLVQTGPCISKALFYTVLRKCVANKDLVLGSRVHALTVERGYQSDAFLATLIFRMYASHGRLQEAVDVFAAVAKPDAFMWSAIISAHVKHGQDKQAIQLYHRMRSSSSTSRVNPDCHVFVATLQACARASDLKTGQQVHVALLASGIQPNLFVWNALVTMYAKCGRLEDALRVFNGLAHKNVVTWNALIAGYAQRGMGQEALRLHTAMEHEGLIAPNPVTFVCLLQACSAVGTPALNEGRHLHAQIWERGHQYDVFVTNSLVNMYAKCGSLEDAQRVFDALDYKDVVTWNAIIAGYSQHGWGQEALYLYRAMQEENMAVPDSVTFVCLLQACASLGTPALEMGKQLHMQITERRHEADVFVASSLVNMYAKCGSVEDAQRVFDRPGPKNEVTWTAMIAGYSQQGLGQKALDLYTIMEEEGGMGVPNYVTLVCLLQACADVGVPALEIGKKIHVLITEQGHQADILAGSSLVNMYAKCGNLEDARRVFDQLGVKNVVTWNAMIAGYSQQGMGQEALCLYRDMEEEGVTSPNFVTFGCLLQACATVGSLALEAGKRLHVQIQEQGQRVDLFVANSLVNMYAKCGSLKDAQELFDGLDHKDVVTWNAMIAAYSQQGMGWQALRLYSAMQAGGMAVPDSVTFVCLLQACASVGTPALENGRQLHMQIKACGHQGDMFVASRLVNMYAMCGSLEAAQRLFNELGDKDSATWTAMIAGYSRQGMGWEALRLHSAMQEGGLAVPDAATFVCLLQACASVGTQALEKGKQLHAQIREGGHQRDAFVGSSLVNMYAKCGSLQDAHRVFDELGEKDVVTWTAIIAGYSQQGMGQEALALYSAMQEGCVAVPNSVTFVCLLQACASVAAVSLGRQLHAEIVEQGLESDVFVAGSLINMYGKCGSMVDAQQVFEALPKRDITAWNALIAGYTCHGDSDAIFDLVQRMKEDGTRPDSITFVSILTVCSHVGLVSKGRDYFESMSRQYGITTMEDHYTCMVDLLGRAGQVDEALALVRSMPESPNAVIWHTLLGACQKWSNVEVGRHAFDEAVKLNKKDAAAYVLMKNIYMAAQKSEQAEKMQAKRKTIRARKQPGQSWWTDQDGLVHSFLVGDEKHALSEAGPGFLHNGERRVCSTSEVLVIDDRKKDPHVCGQQRRAAGDCICPQRLPRPRVINCKTCDFSYCHEVRAGGREENRIRHVQGRKSNAPVEGWKMFAHRLLTQGKVSTMSLARISTFCASRKI